MTIKVATAWHTHIKTVKICCIAAIWQQKHCVHKPDKPH